MIHLVTLPVYIFIFTFLFAFYGRPTIWLMTGMVKSVKKLGRAFTD